MDLINKICLDLSVDRIKIVKKYLVPLILSEKSLKNVNIELLNDVLCVLEMDEVEILKSEIEEILGQEVDENFVNVDWKVGICSACKLSLIHI